jgi:Flp pilus assembly protein TadD
VSLDRLGDVKVARGDLDGAQQDYEGTHAILERLAADEPGNAGWQRDLSVSLNKLGDVKVARGDLDGAQQDYEGSLAIRKRLAADEPGNAEWQRDLSVSLNKLGDVKVARGDLDGRSRTTRVRTPSASAWLLMSPAMPSGSGICR